ncbi:MAG: response regulator [Leptospirales bacterium]|jgi:CheY-like chemotaxis protein
MVSRFEKGARRALIADGDRVAREYLTLVLGKGGYVVEAASLAARALRSMESFRPDLILVDTGFSESGGFSVVRRMRELAFRLKYEPRIVMTTGEDRKFEREQAAAAGAVDYIIKPIQPTPLLRQLSDLMSLESRPVA